MQQLQETNKWEKRAVTFAETLLHCKIGGPKPIEMVESCMKMINIRLSKYINKIELMEITNKNCLARTTAR